VNAIWCALDSYGRKHLRQKLRDNRQARVSGYTCTIEYCDRAASDRGNEILNNFRYGLHSCDFHSPSLKQAHVSGKQEYGYPHRDGICDRSHKVSEGGLLGILLAIFVENATDAACER
jgi:hypothetical protein